MIISITLWIISGFICFIGCGQFIIENKPEYARKLITLSIIIAVIAAINAQIFYPCG